MIQINFYLLKQIYVIKKILYFYIYKSKKLFLINSEEKSNSKQSSLEYKKYENEEVVANNKENIG